MDFTLQVNIIEETAQEEDKTLVKEKTGITMYCADST